MMDDVRNAGGDLQNLDRKGYRYGYGRYVGKVGRVHLGIERRTSSPNAYGDWIEVHLGEGDYMRESSGAD
jgi:hypothetical protein